jgi:maleamate amidohydrolase
MNIDAVRDEVYDRASFGGHLGRGTHPAVLVVDFTLGFTDEGCSFGADMTNEVNATRQVLDAARKADVLAIFTTTGFEPTFKDAGLALQKAPKGVELLAGSRWAELDPRLGRQDGELLIAKTAPSALFGTDLIRILVSNQIDTVILCGAVTSGCIRATCVDLFSYGIPTLVPRDCVGDRAPGPHEANLYDMNAKYADVISSRDAIAYLASLRASVVSPA